MAEEKKKEEKKIIVDEDWKAEAKKEKEVLAAKEKAEKEGVKEPGEKRGPLPPGDFAALVSVLTTQAFFALGILNIKGQDKREPDLEMARYNIDMLQTLQEKSSGNLSEEEAKVLEDTLSQVRMAYVKAAE